MATSSRGSRSNRQGSSAPAAPASSGLDFSALTAEDTGEAIGSVAGNPYRRLEGTPFEQWVRDSREAGTARKVALPSQDDAKKVAYLLRLAAQKLGLGVRIPQPFKTDESGRVVVIFQGKDRAQHDPNKLRKPSKPKKGESQESFQARVRAWEAQSGKTWEPKK